MQTGCATTRTSKASNIYYDGYTLVAQKKGFFNVWTKGIVFDAKGTVRNEQPSALINIDCNRKSAVILKIWSGGQIEKSDKFPAIPEVALKALYKEVCK